MTFTVNGQPRDTTAGETCFIPRGVVHGFNHLNPANAKALAVVTPAFIGPIISRRWRPSSIPAARRIWIKSKR